MHYFFDESGDWYGNERWRLVLGGLLLKQKHALASLDAELRLLKAEHKLYYLHANEMSRAALEDCYSIIKKTLTTSGTAMLRIFSPKIVVNSSRKNADDIYIELAADLISMMIMGDPKPQIHYDMKFHYAYPENIIENTTMEKPHHFQRLIKSHALRTDKYEKELQRIVNKLDKQPRYVKHRIQWFQDLLVSKGHKAVSAYLWSELVLQVQGKESMREIFRKTILDNLKVYSEDNKYPQVADSMTIEYLSKDQGNAGIEVIDILCNLVYKNGVCPPEDVSSTIKDIYSLIHVEEF